MEDLAPERIIILGSGPRLFGAAVAAGDFFLERVVGEMHAALGVSVPRARVAVLGTATRAPASWTDVSTTWLEACARAEATTEIVASDGTPGVVMTPEQGLLAAA